ncbi:hypothetical protein R70006_06260 [Paraburkholderia domus]|nr:hypothetical protein R70006_06260 [Paraburkholderia domus]
MDQIALIDCAERVDIQRVLAALREIRLRLAGQEEAYLTDAIAAKLTEHDIPARREFRFGPLCRADVWIDGIVVEAKKRRPPLAELVAQLTRYAAQPNCRELIVVLERSVPLATEIRGKPVHRVSLHSLWGVAL